MFIIISTESICFNKNEYRYFLIQMVKIKEIDKFKYLLHFSLYGEKWHHASSQLLFQMINNLYKLWIYTDTTQKYKKIRLTSRAFLTRSCIYRYQTRSLFNFKYPRIQKILYSQHYNINLKYFDKTNITFQNKSWLLRDDYCFSFPYYNISMN